MDLQPSYQLIHTKKELQPYIKSLTDAKVFGIDTETTGLDPHSNWLRLVQIAAENLPVLIIDCFSFLPEGKDILKEILEGSQVKIFQNAKFDFQFFMNLDIHPVPLFDTMLAARLLWSSGGPQRANFKAVAKHYLGIDVDKSSQVSDWQGVLTEKQLEYAALDAHLLIALRRVMVEEIIKNKLVKIADIEFKCVPAIAAMEYNGIYVNRADWDRLRVKTEKEKAEALEVLYEYSGQPVLQRTLWGEEIPVGDNFDSNPYILSLLNKNGIHAKGTSKRDLYPYFNHPLVKALSDYRKAAKSLSSFLLPIPELIHESTGRLHPKYGQLIAYSGRMSSFDPNIQQIPRDYAFRKCFCAPKGKKLVIADYSQIELRVAAEIARDETMIEAYNEGQDLHNLTASLMLRKNISDVTKEERQSAKAVNFGLIYGMGPAGLMQYAAFSYGVQMSISQAELFCRRFFEAYKGIGRWHENIKAYTPKEGRTLTGRKFKYTENMGLPNYCNIPVQGTAADITKIALGMLYQELDQDILIIGVIHDEIILECEEEKALFCAQQLRSIMETAGRAVLKQVPVKAEAVVSDSWADK